MRDAATACALGEALPRAVAHNYARVLAYKDEYEVARLYSSDAFREQLAASFDGDYSLTLHLAPPFLGGEGPDGRPRKRRFGSWVLSIFSVLQHGKRLRGSALDPFGYGTERRAERRQITRYEEDMAAVCAELDAARNGGDAARLALRDDVALALLEWPDSVRGFGPVKAEAMEKAAALRTSLNRELLQPRPVDATKVAA